MPASSSSASICSSKITDSKSTGTPWILAERLVGRGGTWLVFFYTFANNHQGKQAGIVMSCHVHQFMFSAILLHRTLGDILLLPLTTASALVIFSSLQIVLPPVFLQHSEPLDSPRSPGSVWFFHLAVHPNRIILVMKVGAQIDLH